MTRVSQTYDTRAQTRRRTLVVNSPTISILRRDSRIEEERRKTETIKQDLDIPSFFWMPRVSFALEGEFIKQTYTTQSAFLCYFLETML